MTLFKVKNKNANGLYMSSPDVPQKKTQWDQIKSKHYYKSLSQHIKKKLKN